MESEDQSSGTEKENKGKSCETDGPTFEEVVPESPEALGSTSFEEVLLTNPFGELMNVPFAEMEPGNSCEVETFEKVDTQEVNDESSEPLGNSCSNIERESSENPEGESSVLLEDTPSMTHEVLSSEEGSEIPVLSSQPITIPIIEHTTRSYEETVQAMQELRRSHPDTSRVGFDELINEVIEYCQKNELEYSPVEILRKLQSVVVQGRTLEIDTHNQAHYAGGGPCSTNQIYVDRENILKTGMEEVKAIDNFRLTLEVVFYGEVGSYNYKV